MTGNGAGRPRIEHFEPKLITVFKEGCGLAQFLRDATAGVIVGVVAQPREVIERSGLADKIGRENVCDAIDDALERARVVMGATA